MGRSTAEAGPGEKNERKLMREDGEGCKAFDLGESAVDQRLNLLL